MDNGSTDRTGQILDRFEGKRDTRIIRNRKNYKLAAYKRLFDLAKGKVIVEIDDDVLEFPKGFDKTICEYLSRFPDYGYIGLDVVQNEKTHGARLEPEQYTTVNRDGFELDDGPTGGWCTGFWRRDWWLLRPFTMFLSFPYKHPEDGCICLLMSMFLRKKHGLIKNAKCLHACGPVYAAEVGLLEREREKYVEGGAADCVGKFR